MSTQVLCAACGKGGDNLKVCTSCEQVSYCNAKCRKAHRSKHKKECRQLAAKKHNEETVDSIDVHVITEKFSSIEISDEELFKDPPPKEDCDICFIPMPSWTKAVYQSCCGKTLCSGCMEAAENEMKKGTMKPCCPFCRVPLPEGSNDEFMMRVKKRMKLEDADAFHTLGEAYSYGNLICQDNLGLPQDHKKGFELLLRGAELGSIKAHCSLANAYDDGSGVKKDLKKAIIHFKLAAIGGHEVARYNLGILEEANGNMDTAMKHYMIAARCGYDDSLKKVGEGYKAGCVTKEEYASILRAHKQSTEEMKSEQRRKTALIHG